MEKRGILQELHAAMTLVADAVLKRVDSETGLCLTGPFNGETGMPIRIECNPEDFGDFLPFVYSAGTTLGDPRFSDFAVDQFRLAEEKLLVDGTFFQVYSKSKSADPHPPVLSQDQADALLGLNLMYSLTGQGSFLSLAERLCTGLIRESQTQAGYLLDVIRPRRFWERFLKLVKPTVNGTLAEEMLHLSRFSSNDSFQHAALEVLDYWTSRWEFVENGLLPDGIFPYVGYPAKKFGRFMKTNSNVLHACLAAHRITRNLIWRKHAEWGVECWLDFRGPDGTIPKIVHSRTGEVLVQTRELTQHFTLIDLLLDLFHLEGGELFLEAAVKVAEPWLALYSELKLIPEGMRDDDVEVELSFTGVPLPAKLSWRATKLDQMSDMGVSLLKLAEKTKNESLKQRAIESILALAKTHRTDNSFVSAVDYETGAVLRSTNWTKYLGGYLKGLLAAHSVLNGQSLFEEKVWFLLRDR